MLYVCYIDRLVYFVYTHYGISLSVVKCDISITVFPSTLYIHIVSLTKKTKDLLLWQIKRA